MARKMRVYDDDDGRTIASMSGIERPSLFGHLPGQASAEMAPPPTAEEVRQQALDSQADEAARIRKAERPWEADPEPELSTRERLGIAFAALKATLLIWAVFVAAGGLFIFLLTRFD